MSRAGLSIMAGAIIVWAACRGLAGLPREGPTGASPAEDDLEAKLREVRAGLEDVAVRLDHLRKSQEEVFVLRGPRAPAVRKALAEEIARLQQQQAKLKGDEAALLAQIRLARDRPPAPASQPGSAEWLTVEGTTSAYMSLPGAERTLRGKMVMETIVRRPIPAPGSMPAEGDPGPAEPVLPQPTIERFFLETGQGRTPMSGQTLKLYRFAGRQVEVRCKPLNPALGGQGLHRVGWVRPAADLPATQPDRAG